ncbi:hypothetical protein AGABI2DRAFT_189610 [Agaricus bisporus var. bisporus H97]|uniref:hypothetical protein n=1 Tax=Agaricus bisporus var. bisporus (strain H97 / ATCC MYA-4626 / FGSC 10389) TaxID=936046 RepID=UPI00029F5A99|nr:hypothetical protein AGABI2DRAFT_189610 [Agaricus bisporus var. bisporus H97]EKV51357.1 hypothetical protein AGABI2DRAFT_189610 [Agaricus bisporus var. bisporus H97]
MSSAYLRNALCRASRRASVSGFSRLSYANAPPRYVLASKTSFIHTSYPRFQKFRPSHALRTCLSCSKPLASSIPACTNCWSISLLPSDISHHELLGLSYEPNPFVVDPSVLKQRFLQAQAVCHPDTWASKGAEKQDIAQVMSARVNEAYRTLLKPLYRAEYILGRDSVPVSEEDQEIDSRLMIEIMKARESVDDAEEAGEVVNLMEENDEKINKTVHQIERLVHEKNWPGAKAATTRLRYLEGVSHAAKQWLDNH